MRVFKNLNDKNSPYTTRISSNKYLFNHFLQDILDAKITTNVQLYYLSLHYAYFTRLKDLKTMNLYFLI